MFSSFDSYFVSEEGVLMNASRFALALVVFVDTGLFPLSNMFPVGNVFDILNQCMPD